MSHLSLKRSVSWGALVLSIAVNVAPLRMTGAQGAYASPAMTTAVARRPSSPITRAGACAGNLVTAQPSTGWDSDLVDAADDSIYAEILAPGSGMVAVDAHGRLITSGDPAPYDAAAAPDCCTAFERPSGPKPAVDLPANYTASKGRGLARCADSMKPPPSSRSPL